MLMPTWLMIILTIGLVQQVGASKKAPSATVDLAKEPQIPTDISTLTSLKDEKQPIALEGQFIVPEGNSDHLFRPYDFIKEEAIQLGAKNDKVRTTCDIQKPSLPRVQIFEGHFIHYEQDADKHLFDQEDFEKHDAIID